MTSGFYTWVPRVTAPCHALGHAEGTPIYTWWGGEAELRDSGRGGADYQLVWPRLLFQSEAAALLNNYRKLNDWDSRCELLLEDAFAGVAPRDDFLAEEDRFEGGPTDSRKSFLVSLLRRAPVLSEAALGRAPYWSERQRVSRPGAVSLAGIVREFVTVINDLDRRGYFEKSF